MKSVVGPALSNVRPYQAPPSFSGGFRPATVPRVRRILPGGARRSGDGRGVQGQQRQSFAVQLSAVVSSQQPWLHSYAVSLELSAISAVLAGVIGLVRHVALVSSNSATMGKLVTTACGVLANTGGVPLAFAFIATIGNAGIVTHVLAGLGLNPYDHGWSLYSFSGLVVVYLYFLLPLVILLMLPPVEALRREWREAAATLGADTQGVLAEGRPARPDPAFHRHAHGPVHGRLRRLCHGRRADHGLGPPGADRDRVAARRECGRQPGQPRRRPRLRHDRHSQRRRHAVRHRAAQDFEVATVRRVGYRFRRVVLGLVALYFIIPMAASVQFSLEAGYDRRLSLSAYSQALRRAGAGARAC